MRPFLACLALALVILGPVPAGADCPPDTLDIYGGPGGLEGKFQTADGQPDAQGWTHTDDSVAADPYWQVSTVGAANLDPPTPDNHAWWCGAAYPACDQDDPAWGYGNDWDTALAWTGAVDPDRAAAVRLTGVVNVDVESGYDHLRVEFVKNGSVVLASAWDGRHEALVLDETVTYQPGEFVDGAVRVQLRVVTDGGWSDADCSWPSAGAVQADNLQVTVTQGGDPPWSSPVETCEPGVPTQWQEVPPSGFGDFAQLWTDLPELDPGLDNASPQWAFLDDGLVVPGVGPTFAADPAYPEGTFAVNESGGLGGPPLALTNSLWSPPVALPAGGCGPLLLAYDVYFDVSSCAPVYEVCGLAATADPAGQAGWVDIPDPFLRVGTGGRFHRSEVAFPADALPTDARFVRIRLQARQLPTVWCWEPDPSPGLYFDNVRLQLAPEAPSPVPAGDRFTATAAPNPFNPAVTIAWTQARAGDLDVRIFDVSGRLVRTLRSGPAAAGPGRVVWRGRDDTGRAAAAGLYFCTVRGEAGRRTLKLTLLK